VEQDDAHRRLTVGAAGAERHRGVIERGVLSSACEQGGESGDRIV